jgi:hypothetical protein
MLGFEPLGGGRVLRALRLPVDLTCLPADQRCRRDGGIAGGGDRCAVRARLGQPVPAPGPGLKKSDGSYDKAVKAIIGLGAKLDDRTKARAEYWADGPDSEQPPGHWHLFAGAMSRKRGQSIDQDAKLNFAVANALLDASITTWNAKRRYDFIRPVTAVRTTHAGKTIKAWAGRARGPRSSRPSSSAPHPHPAPSRLRVGAQHLQRRRRPGRPVLHRERKPGWVMKLALCATTRRVPASQAAVISVLVPSRRSRLVTASHVA